MWASWGYFELPVWSNSWGKAIPSEFYFGLLSSPSRPCHMSFCWSPCCFLSMPSLGCKSLEISLSIRIQSIIDMLIFIPLELESSSCSGKNILLDGAAYRITGTFQYLGTIRDILMLFSKERLFQFVCPSVKQFSQCYQILNRRSQSAVVFICGQKMAQRALNIINSLRACGHISTKGALFPSTQVIPIRIPIYDIFWFSFNLISKSYSIRIVYRVSDSF